MPPTRPRKDSVSGRSPGARQPPKRFLIAIVAVLFLAIIYLLSSTSSVPKPPTTVADITEKAHQVADKFPRPKIPKLYNPFGDVAHEPPEEQENSSHGDTKWYSDLKWLQNPFSSSVTLDENRALLPPLPSRTRVYTYYDTSGQKDSRTIDAEHHLLLTWRRAWWAQGFKPIVLGHPEAKKHASYTKLQGLKLDPPLRSDIERWMAWAHMGTGVLANWLTLPMAPHDDETLSFLRNGRFQKLTSYKSLKGGLLAGEKGMIDTAISMALKDLSLATATTIHDVVSKFFDIHPTQEGLAYYDLPTITASYKVISNQLTSSSSSASGLSLLAQLINAHLHTTWQSAFTGGIAVLQPYPQQTHALVSYATRLAQDLIQCPKSPMPDACPPNRPTCKLCTSYNSKLPLLTPATFTNRSGIFTIGTVPHPYTFTSLYHKRDVLTTKFIRRDTERDIWILGATKEILGSSIGGPQRLPRIKEAVAGSWATSRSTWVTAELEEQMHADWVFGFELPGRESVDGWTGNGNGNDVTKDMSRNNAANNKADVASSGGSKDNPTQQELSEEYRRLERAKVTLKQKVRTEVEMVEAWNLADAEVWRFVRAFATRRKVERLAWEEEERKFAGAEKRGVGWGAWLIEHVP